MKIKIKFVDDNYITLGENGVERVDKIATLLIKKT